MSVNNLTGTTWKFNSNISSYGIEYNINFTSNSNNYIKLELEEWDELYGDSYLEIHYDSTTVFNSSGWLNSNYKTITITGGEDVTDNSLILFLQNNATLVEDYYLVSKSELTELADIIRQKRNINNTFAFPTGFENAVNEIVSTIGANDEGKVVSNGILVTQGSQTVMENGIIDTTLIGSLTVNVSGGSSGVYVGTDAPTSSIGSNGDYYYRRASFPYGYRETPTILSSTSKSGYEFTANSDIDVIGLRGYVKSSGTGSLILGDLSGTILKQVNDVAFSANNWTEVIFDSPVHLTSGNNYIAMIAASSIAYQYASDATFAISITYVRGRYGSMPGTTESGILYGVDIIRDTDALYVTEQYYKVSGAWEKIA